MKRAFTICIYVPDEFRQKWKEFVKICVREGESVSQKLQSWICDYVEKHEPGNPQTRLDTLGAAAPITGSRIISVCRYYGGESKGEIYCQWLTTWGSPERCEKCRK